MNNRRSSSSRTPVHAPPSSEDDVIRAVNRGRSASRQWESRDLHQRARALGRLRRWLTEHLDDVVRQIIEDTGKPEVEVLTGDLLVTLQFLRYYETTAPDILRTESRSSPLFYFGDTSEVEHRPHGVIGMISPWNYPLQLTLVPAITALAAGNAVVIKPSKETPRIHDLLETLNRVLAGPDHLLSVLRGGENVGQHLIDAEPDMIFFTGSVETGKKIRKRAASQLIPVELELGGKDPMIVCEDARIKRAARAATWGAFSNAGQMCTSIERLYVQESVFHDFLQELVQETSRLTVGSGPDADVGPMIRDDQVQKVRQHVNAALDDGATLETDFSVEDRLIQPIILTDVTHDMDVMQQETFGPVVGVVPFDSDREAVRLANDSRYGLNASIFSADTDRARRIASRLDVGSCFINNVITNVGNPSLPFGGNKASGLGRYHGPEGLYAFTKTTSVMTDGFPMEQEINWFPYTRSFYENLKEMIRLRFGDHSFPEQVRRGILLVRTILFEGLR